LNFLRNFHRHNFTATRTFVLFSGLLETPECLFAFLLIFGYN
jgi:hypothetical protein